MADTTNGITITNVACKSYFPQHKGSKENTDWFCWGDKNIDKLLEEEKSPEFLLDENVNYKLDVHEELIYPSVVKHLGLLTEVLEKEYNPGDNY